MYTTSTEYRNDPLPAKLRAMIISLQRWESGHHLSGKCSPGRSLQKAMANDTSKLVTNQYGILADISESQVTPSEQKD